MNEAIFNGYASHGPNPFDGPRNNSHGVRKVGEDRRPDDECQGRICRLRRSVTPARSSEELPHGLSAAQTTF
jgi:hypothetical protein